MSANRSVLWPGVRAMAMMPTAMPTTMLTAHSAPISILADDAAAHRCQQPGGQRDAKEFVRQQRLEEEAFTAEAAE